MYFSEQKLPILSQCPSINGLCRQVQKMAVPLTFYENKAFIPLTFFNGTRLHRKHGTVIHLPIVKL